MTIIIIINYNPKYYKIYTQHYKYWLQMSAAFFVLADFFTSVVFFIDLRCIVTIL